MAATARNASVLEFIAVVLFYWGSSIDSGSLLALGSVKLSLDSRLLKEAELLLACSAACIRNAITISDFDGVLGAISICARAGCTVDLRIGEVLSINSSC